MRVLAIGATGQFAGLVVPALVSRGVEVRAFVRDPAKQGQAKEAGADEVAVGNLRDPASVRAALLGVDGVFLIIPAFAPDTSALGTGIVAAAQEAGVRRAVFSGVYHPSLSLVNHASTRPVEEALYHSDLEFIILQPAMFMQGLLDGWQSAVYDGAFVAPYSKDSTMTFVDYRDVSEAAAVAFATDDLVNGTFELAAGGTVTRTGLAPLMSRHAGREVTARDVEPGAALGQMPAGPMKDGLLAMFATTPPTGSAAATAWFCAPFSAAPRARWKTSSPNSAADRQRQQHPRRTHHVRSASSGPARRLVP